MAKTTVRPSAEEPVAPVTLAEEEMDIRDAKIAELEQQVAAERERADRIAAGGPAEILEWPTMKYAKRGGEVVSHIVQDAVALARLEKDTGLTWSDNPADLS